MLHDNAAAPSNITIVASEAFITDLDLDSALGVVEAITRMKSKRTETVLEVKAGSWLLFVSTRTLDRCRRANSLHGMIAVNQDSTVLALSSFPFL
jgi:hypothetical protein